MNKSQSAAGAALAAVTSLLTGGTLVLYGGTQPANPSIATTSTALVTMTISGSGSTNYSASGSGIASQYLSFATSIYSVSASGTITWARAYSSSGSPILDFSCGLTGADIDLITTTAVAGANFFVPVLAIQVAYP